MKRWLTIGIALLLVSLPVAGCGAPQEEYDAVVAEAEVAKVEAASLQSQLNDAKGDLARAESELAEAQSELAGVQDEIEAAQSARAAAQSEISSLESQVSSLQSQIASLQSEIAAAEARITTETVAYWPTEGWRTSTPEEQDMDSAKLDEVIGYIERMDKGGMPVNSILVVRHGYIVLEEYPQPDYDQDTADDIRSTTKSFASALIGIAIEEGYIEGIEQKMVDLFPERTIKNLDSRKESITLEHILTMKAGLEWNEWQYPYTDPKNDYLKALYSDDPVQYVLDLPMMEEPGVRWNYNGGTSDLLSSLITEATGYDTLGFAQEFLFDPLGITDVSWSRDDRHGLYYAGFGLQLTARDLAKFGYLYLKNGTWDGEQIVPADFVAESVKTHSPFSAARGYGYQSWWTYPQRGVYYAAGLNGQRIYVVPDLDLVVIFTSNMSLGDPEFWMSEMLFDYIMAACD